LIFSLALTGDLAGSAGFDGAFELVEFTFFGHFDRYWFGKQSHKLVGKAGELARRLLLSKHKT